MSDMTDPTGQVPSGTHSSVADRPPQLSVPRGVDLRQQFRWVPLGAGLLALVIGLGYIIEGLSPHLYHRRLRGLSDILPGTLVNLTRTTDVIIGVLLLMLSHGLRRRKRRARRHRAWRSWW